MIMRPNGWKGGTKDVHDERMEGAIKRGERVQDLISRGRVREFINCLDELAAGNHLAEWKWELIDRVEDSLTRSHHDSFTLIFDDEMNARDGEGGP